MRTVLVFFTTIIPLWLSLIWVPAAHAQYSMNEMRRSITEKDWKIVWVIDQEIRELQSVLRNNRAPTRRAEFFHRLSALYQEKANQVFLWEGAYYRNLVKQKLDGGAPADHRLSESLHQNSMTLAKQVIRQYPRYPDRLEIFYSIGVSYAKLGNTDQSLNWFKRVVREGGPEAKVHGEALVAIGESYFNRRDFAQAKNYLGMASRSQNFGSYTKALYFLAMAHYNLKEYNQGYSILRRLVEIGDGGGRFISFEAEALDLLPEYFLAMETPAPQVIAAISRYMPRHNMFYSLGKFTQVYDRRGRHNDVEHFQRVRFQHAANSDERFEVVFENIDRYEKNGKLANMAEELDKLGQAIASKRENPSEHWVDRLNRRLRNTASKFHKMAQETTHSANKRFLYSSSAKLYQRYLSNNPRAEDFYQVTFYLADVTYQQNDHLGAARIHQFILASNTKDTKIRQDAAAQQLIVLDEALRESLSDRQRQVVRRQLLVATDSYIREHPRDKNLPAVQLAAAGTAVELKDDEEALKRYMWIIARYPSSEETKVAAEAILEHYEKRENWQGLADSAERVAGVIKGAQGRAFQTRLEEVAIRGHFKVAEVLQEKGDYLAAAQKFESVARNTKTREAQYSALQNASRNFRRAKNDAGFERVTLGLIANYPDDKAVRDRWLELADSYFAQGRFAEAAKAYFDFQQQTRLLKEPPPQAQMISALQNSALIYHAIKESRGRDQSARALLEAYPQSSASEELTFIIAQDWIDQGRTHEALELLATFRRNFPRSNRVVEAEYLTAKAYWSQGRYDRAYSAYQNTVREFARLPNQQKRGSLADMAAEARFQLVTENFARYQNMRIGGDQGMVQPKLVKLGSLTEEYTDVINIGSSHWGLAALVRLGQSYEGLATDLVALNTHMMGDSNRQLASAEPSPLIEQSNRVNSTARDYYLEGIQLGNRFEVASSHMRELWMQLSKAEPARYRPIQAQDWGGARPMIMDVMHE